MSAVWETDNKLSEISYNSHQEPEGLHPIFHKTWVLWAAISGCGQETFLSHSPEVTADLGRISVAALSVSSQWCHLSLVWTLAPQKLKDSVCCKQLSLDVLNFTVMESATGAKVWFSKKEWCHFLFKSLKLSPIDIGIKPHILASASFGALFPYNLPHPATGLLELSRCLF